MGNLVSDATHADSRHDSCAICPQSMTRSVVRCAALPHNPFVAGINRRLRDEHRASDDREPE